MFELTKHKAYGLLKTTWNRVSLDYVILSVGKEYEGYATHKLAVIEAFRILELRFAAFDADALLVCLFRAAVRNAVCKVRFHPLS